MEKKDSITATDLLPGQEKVVSYVGKDFTVIVPDHSWDMVGDLSRLPAPIQAVLTHYSQNGFTKEQAIVDANTHSLRLPSGSRVLNDINANGYSIDDKQVVFLGEFDSKGNRL